ncbi:MAG: alpha/beta fold hydrolase [Thermodesulfobacteriota bacterium]
MTDFRTVPISFTSDDLVLKGVLHLPETLPAPFVVGCHGLFADKESPKQIALAQACCRAGVAFFRFDHRGCHESAGVFAEVTSLAARCRDLADAVDMLRQRKDLGPLTGLFGSSMGGTVVLASARRFMPVRLVTVAAPLVSGPVINAIKLSNDPVLEKMPARFFETALQFDISREVKGLHDILIVHGDADQVVPYENAERLFAACDRPKKLLRHKNGDHRITDPGHQEEFLRQAAAWLTGKI